MKGTERLDDAHCNAKKLKLYLRGGRQPAGASEPGSDLHRCLPGNELAAMARKGEEDGQ